MMHNDYYRYAANYYNAACMLFDRERDREFNSIHVFGPVTLCIGHAFELTLKAYIIENNRSCEHGHDIKYFFDKCINDSLIDIESLGQRARLSCPIEFSPHWLMTKAIALGFPKSKDGTIFNLNTQVASLSQNFFKSLKGDVAGKKFLARYPEKNFPHHKYDIELILSAIRLLLEDKKQD